MENSWRPSIQGQFHGLKSEHRTFRDRTTGQVREYDTMNLVVLVPGDTINIQIGENDQDHVKRLNLQSMQPVTVYLSAIEEEKGIWKGRFHSIEVQKAK